MKTLKDYESLKRCSKCKKHLPTELFGLNNLMKDKLNTWCRPCKSKAKKQYYRANKPKVLKSCQVYRDANIEAVKRRRKAWKAKNPDRVRYPTKTRVRNQTLRLVREGLIEKKPCVVCGSFKVEAHHLDYSQPDKIMWLCVSHHKAWHKLFIPENIAI